jgi:hypothetical protein
MQACRVDVPGVARHVLSVHPYLVEEDGDPAYSPNQRFRAALGIVLHAIAGLAGWLSTPKLAMLIFLAFPVFYGIPSQGLRETPLRLQFGRAHRRSSAKADHEGSPNSVLSAVRSYRPAARNLHGRQPVLPHRRIDRRTVGPFQAPHDGIDLLVGRAKSLRNHFEKDSHRVIALNQGDSVGRVHYGHILNHGLAKQAFAGAGLLAKS